MDEVARLLPAPKIDIKISKDAIGRLCSVPDPARLQPARSVCDSGVRGPATAVSQPSDHDSPRHPFGSLERFFAIMVENYRR